MWLRRPGARPMVDPSLNKAIATLLQAFPGHSVVVCPDGATYRAGLIPTPACNAFTGRSSECRDDPNQAVLRLRAIFIDQAQDQLCRAKQHLDNLHTSPFSADGAAQRQSPASSGDK